ncbi:MAG: type II toxin-antitoxin system VapC family toxin [Pyrinomonadaceae bacterium]
MIRMISLLKYLVDTNACIRYLTGRSVLLRDKIIVTPISQISVCSIVKAEMYYGSMNSQIPQKSLKEQNEFLINFNLCRLMTMPL